MEISRIALLSIKRGQNRSVSQFYLTSDQVYTVKSKEVAEVLNCVEEFIKQ